MPRVDATSYIRYTLRTRRPVVSNERGSPMSPALVLQSLPWIVALVEGGAAELDYGLKRQAQRLDRLLHALADRARG